MVKPVPALLLLASLAACTGTEGLGTDGESGQPGADSAVAGWTVLFDGATLDGWHGYARDDSPGGWSVEDGVLTLTPGSDDGGDLIADGTWSDFELEVVWQIAECGNSGIFYRGEEDEALAPVWRTALEMQIVDTCHPDAKYPSHRTGSLYDLYAPAETTPTARRDIWNTLRVVADGDRIEHWLNGTRIVTAQQGSPEWGARLAVSKFRDGDAFPAYGTRRAGLVGLQDHGDTLRVRSVRIRTL